MLRIETPLTGKGPGLGRNPGIDCVSHTDPKLTAILLPQPCEYDYRMTGMWDHSGLFVVFFPRSKDKTARGQTTLWLHVTVETVYWKDTVRSNSLPLTM